MLALVSYSCVRLLFQGEGNGEPTHYLRSCDFQAIIAMFKTLGLEATGAERSLTLHIIRAKQKLHVVLVMT